MLRLLTNFLLLALLAAATSNAGVVLTATLTNAQESSVTLTTSTGAARPASFGTASFFINDAMTSMTFSATVFNIDFGPAGMRQTADDNDNLAAAHIHAPAPPGTNTGVVWGFFGSPFNDNSPNDVVMTPFSTGVGGTISGKWDLSEGNGTTFTAQLPNILAGLSYINFHTVQNGGGEIRGQILATPEPASLVLFGSGGLVLMAFLRCRRTRA